MTGQSSQEDVARELLIHRALASKPWRPSTIAFAIIAVLLYVRLSFFPDVPWWAALAALPLALVVVFMGAFKEARP